jgi:hypothetical protein
MSRVRIKNERRFNPHRSLLLPSAEHFLRTAKEKKDGWYYDCLAAILLSALSIEAIGNSYGKVKIPDWNRFERASPIAKLRLVATSCGVKPNFGKEPWQTVERLIFFRNRIAHAKREHLKKEESCSVSDYGKKVYPKLEPDWVKMVNLDFASKSCNAVEQIIRAFERTLKDSELAELAVDGQEFSAQILEADVA